MKNNLLIFSVLSTLLSQPVWAVDLIGQTRSKQPINVVSEISGKVEVAAMETGEGVESGVTLATIKAQDFELEVSKQSANLELVKADLKVKQALYERYLELRKKNSLSQNELDIAEADFDSAKATVTLAQIELKKARLDLVSTRINASIDGYVVNRTVERGTWVNQGDLLYHVVNIDRLNVRLLASEFDLSELHVGQAIELWAEAAPEHKVRSTIKRIGVEVDPQNFAYPVEVEIDNPKHTFKPGMSIRATTSIKTITPATAPAPSAE